MNDDPIVYFGRTNGRAPHRRFGIKEVDRFSHVYVIGRTGTGKTTMLEAMALQDIRANRGLCVVDPHGDLAGRLVAAVTESRRSDLIYLDATDPTQPFGYNPLKRVHRDRVPLVASGLLDAFRKIWSHEWGVRMEHILRNALLALIEHGDAELSDVLELMTTKRYRTEVLKHVTNEQVRSFWTREYPRYNPRYAQEAIAPVQNKIGAFLADPRLRRIVSGGDQDVRIREIMDNGKILIVNLGKGALGDDTAQLLGALLVSSIALSAFSRLDTADEGRRPFFLYMDEFQSFTTLSVANMISELRKFKIGMTLANQHLYQLEPAVRHAVLGNAGTLISFRIGPEDAHIIGREFEPTFVPIDLTALPNYHFYTKLMVDSAPSRPFSATSLRPDWNAVTS